MLRTIHYMHHVVCTRQHTSNPNSQQRIKQISQALLPQALRAQGPKRSTHVSIAWQLVPPHERKHVTKEVLVEPLALPQLLVQLGGNKAVQGLPPAIDALGPSNAGHAGRLLLQRQLAGELPALVADSHALHLPLQTPGRVRPCWCAVRKQGGNPGGAQAVQQTSVLLGSIPCKPHKLLGGLNSKRV